MRQRAMEGGSEGGRAHIRKRARKKRAGESKGERERAIKRREGEAVERGRRRRRWCVCGGGGSK